MLIVHLCASVAQKDHHVVLGYAQILTPILTIAEIAMHPLVWVTCPDAARVIVLI